MARYEGYVSLIASASFLQAQTDYTGGNLDIDAPGGVPSNVATITTISGNLTIGGTITSFPDFAALEVVEGNIEIYQTLTDVFG